MSSVLYSFSPRNNAPDCQEADLPQASLDLITPVLKTPLVVAPLLGYRSDIPGAPIFMDVL